MTRFRTVHLTNIDDLRSSAAAWDDLWWRSETSMPTVRAELLARWIKKFAPRAGFHAVAVEEDGRLIAALPLITRRLAGVLTAGVLSSNPWSPCGDLLLDQSTDTSAALDAVLGAVRDGPWQWLWLNDTEMHAPRWREFALACDRAGSAWASHERFCVARIDMSSDWDSFQKNLSRTHRQAVSKAVRRLGEEGEVRFEMFSHLDPRDVKPLLEKVFEVEDRSWKGASGSSVLRSPGLFDFFLAQAEQLAQWGQLEIALLELEGHVVAGLYGFSAKGVYFAHKIGYDPRFAQFSPGQVMFWNILERLHSDGQWRTIDCIGPLTEALSRWRPATYAIGRIVVAPGRMAGRAAMHAYQKWWPAVRKMRKSLAGRSSDENPVESPLADPLGVPG